MKFTRSAFLLALAVIVLFASMSFNAKAKTLIPVTAAAAVQPNISINGYYAMDRAQRGRSLQAAVVIDIPKGYHVNANKPLGKYAVPTTVKLDVGDNVQVSAVNYPKAIVRSFSFSEEKLGVYEGRAVMRFNVTVPAGFPHSKMLLKAKVKYQSCSEEVCYPPVTRDIEMWIGIAGDGEAIKRANGNIFGGKKG